MKDKDYKKPSRSGYKNCTQCYGLVMKRSLYELCANCRRASKSKRNCLDCKKRLNPNNSFEHCYKCLLKCPKCEGTKTPAAVTCMPCHAKGRYTHTHKSKDGYIFKSAPNHPRVLKRKANSNSDNTYVPEHVLIMEQKLGRYLISGENVHHKNGVRDDNRPENLELWVTHQPRGQRPEDLVIWAKEILNRYEQ